MKHLLEQFGRLVIAMMLFCVVGCGSPAPDEVAKECVDCLQEADFAGMRELASGDMLKWIDRAEVKYAEVTRLIGEKTAEKLKDTYGELKYKFGEVKVEGEKAIISVKINGQDTPMTLIKQGENWRIERFDFPII